MNPTEPEQSTVMAHKIQHLPYAVDESNDRHHYFENHWKRTALALLRRHAGEVRDLTLLDYGCGRGETMAYASQMGMRVSGLDADAECVRLASQYGPAHLLDLESPIKQVGRGSFDVVACFHVLEHVDNPKAVLRMLAEAARRYVLIAVPNLQQIPNLRKPRASPGRCNEGHLQSWDHAHFRNLAENHCGLRIIDWANDATIVPVASEIIRRTLGNKAVIGLETGLFRRLFPYWGISIIALLQPAQTQH
jgi:SAM-dependent methyltransferase